MRKTHQALVPALVVLAVASCGGGGSADSDTPVSGDLAALDLAYDGAVPPGDAVADGVEGDAVLPDGDAAEIVPCEPATDGTFSLACPGMVTDSRNGLVWQAAAEYQGWTDARAACEALVLAGHEDWRLPTVDDHRAMLAGCAKTGTGGTCGISVACWRTNCSSDPCFWGCGKGAGTGADTCYLSGLFEQPCQTYWSSTQAEKDGMGTTRAWVVSYLDAAITVAPASGDAWYRCVRGP
jgi:hypothetical protein